MKKNVVELAVLIIIAALLLAGCSSQEEEAVPATEITTPIDEGISPFNQLLTGSIQTAEEIAAYRFMGVADQTVYLELLSIEAGAITFTLTGPDGREVFATTGRDYNPSLGNAKAALRHEGEYTLTLNPTGEEGTAYTFIFWDVNPPIIEAGDLQPGALKRGQLNVPGQVVEYRLEGYVGQPLFLELHTIENGNLDFVLTGPDGREVFATTGRDYNPTSGNAETALRLDGYYTLALNPHGADIPTYTFTLWDVGEAVIEEGLLQFGALNRGQIATPGQVVIYQLTGSADQMLFLEITLLENGSMDFVLTGPDGREVSTTTGRDYNPSLGNATINLRQAGDYTLTLNPRDADTPSYLFTLWDIDPQRITGEMIQFDMLIRGEVEIPGQIVEYPLEGEVGQNLLLEVLAIDEGAIDFILTGPDGRELFSTTGRDYNPSLGNIEFSLAQEGQHLLVISPRDAARPAFEFVIQLQEE